MNRSLRQPNSAAAIQYGQSLPGIFYSDAGIFAEDLRILGRTQWQLADHASRIPRAGDYFLFSVGAESLIVIRDREHAVHALYNVCRHRGSRVCLEQSGHLAALVCPYHSWTYALDGRLCSAAAMDEDFDKTEYALRRAHVRVEQGFIFVNLAPGSPPDFEAFIARPRAFMTPHGFAEAKVAARRLYPTNANWKLIVENFLECYHCKPAHPTYCSVHSSDKLLAFGAGPGSASEDLVSIPIGGGYATESIGGGPVAPLMGSYAAYDYAQTAINFNPVAYVISSSDHAVVFRFTPRAPLHTDVEALWLVRESASEGRDYDAQTLIHVWDVTLGEDKTITENNQAGVLSEQYAPGPHSRHEKRISDFVAWYTERLNMLREIR